MTAALSVDELGIDPNAGLVSLHRTFQNVTYAQLLADLPGVGILALEGKGGVARDDEGAAEARKVRGQILSNAVGEIVLGWVAGKIGEWQHNDGEVRRLGGRRRCDGRGSVGAGEMPRGGASGEQEGDCESRQRQH